MQSDTLKLAKLCGVDFYPLSLYPVYGAPFYDSEHMGKWKRVQ